MFVQVISMQVPINHLGQLRSLLADEYLPAVRQRPGFISAHLLEKVDDPDTAELIIYWDHQKSLENTIQTGVLSGSEDSIAARIPGLRLRRESYIVRVTVDNTETASV